MNDLRRYLRIVEAAIPQEGKHLYHFVISVKKLIALLRDNAIKPGNNGRVSLTFDPAQTLFRYAAAVLVLDGAKVRQALDLTRYKGDAASLAGGDEFELYANDALTPLSNFLVGITVRQSVFRDDAASFKAQYGITKGQLQNLLKDWSRSVKVQVTDFNDTDKTWHQQMGEARLAHTDADDQKLDRSMVTSFASKQHELKSLGNLGNIAMMRSSYPYGFKVFFIAEDVPVGFAIVQDRGDGPYVSLIWLKPEHRRQGLATKFYRYLQSTGLDLKPDKDQTDAGAALWQKLQ